MEPYSITVAPKQFLLASYKRYPILKEDVSLRKLFCHIVRQTVGGKHDYALLNAKLLAHIEKKTEQQKSRNYVGYKILDKFSEHVLPINYVTNKFGDTYNYTKGEARRGNVDIPLDLLELYKNKEDEKLYIESNRKFSKESSVAKQKMKKQEKEFAQSFEPLNEPQRQLLDYLNNLKSNRFSKIKQYIPEARLLLDEIVNERSRTRASKLLDQVELQPQPFYKPSERGATQRIFGSGYLQLNKELREILTQDWVEIDISQAQLRINAWLWKVPEVTKILDENRSVWDELIKYIQDIYLYEFSKVDKANLKGILKKYLYATCFGMTMTNIKKKFKEECEETLGIEYKVNKFKTARTKSGQMRLSLGEYLIKNEIIEPLEKAREKIMKRIKTEKGANSPYGWVPYKGSVISVMASVAQAMEQLLMTPIVKTSIESEVIEKGKKSYECQIMGFIHDGVYLKIRNKKEWGRYFKKMYKEWIKIAKQGNITIDVEVRLDKGIKKKIRINKDSNEKEIFV